MMATLRQVIAKRLFDNGLFEHEAAQVIELSKDDLVIGEEMLARWDEDESGYPPQFLPVLWLSMKWVTLKWIDANKPLAWYRPLFVD